MKKTGIAFLAALLAFATACGGSDGDSASTAVDDSVIEAQYDALDAAYEAEPFGPQAPRDIESAAGTNPITFDVAPPAGEMNLCNIHFHEGAEHSGGDYTTYAGNGDGEGYESGYLFDGDLSDDEVADFDEKVGANEHGELVPGDTIEIHYVHTTDDITPGPTLGACLASDDSAPQLRVEAQVFVLVNDASAASLVDLTTIEQVNGLFQAVNIPNNAGTPINYLGSTTGPAYNEKGSPFMVSWSVRPQVIKVDIASVAAWFADNPFDETYAHAVRNLVTNPEHLSPIG